MKSMQPPLASLVLSIVVLGGAPSARAAGIPETVGKGAVKGAVKAVQEQVTVADLTKGAKEVIKGAVDGIGTAVPRVARRIVDQADTDKDAMGSVARTVTGEAVAGAVEGGNAELVEAIGRKGDGPMADALVAMTERLTGAIVRGLKAETPEVHLVSPVWKYAAAFALGGVATFLTALGMLLLYIAFARRRTPLLVAPEASPGDGQAAPPHAQPAPGTT